MAPGAVAHAPPTATPVEAAPATAILEASKLRGAAIQTLDREAVVGRHNVVAVEMLLHPRNRNVYDGRGVNAGGNPCLYLPGNGGLLYAIGMMAGGWDGGPEVDRSRDEAPGFPRNGQWVVRCAGFVAAP